MFYFVNPFSLVSPAVCTCAVPCVSLSSVSRLLCWCVWYKILWCFSLVCFSAFVFYRLGCFPGTVSTHSFKVHFVFTLCLPVFRLHFGSRSALHHHTNLWHHRVKSGIQKNKDSRLHASNQPIQTSSKLVIPVSRCRIFQTGIKCWEC